MEQYVDIPTEIDTGDIEIETCDEVTPTSNVDAAQRFYIVQQTPEGLVIQIAEQVDGNTVVTHSQPATTDLVTSALLNGGDLANLVASEVPVGVTSGVVVTDAVASSLIGADVTVGKVSAGDDLTSDPLDVNICEANEPVAVLCEARPVDDANFHDRESVHGGVTTDHAYVGSGPKEQFVSAPTGVAANSIPNTVTPGTSNAMTIENTDSGDFTKSVQEDVSDIIVPDVQEDVSEVLPNVQEQVSDIEPHTQEHVSDIIPDVQEHVSDIVPDIQEHVSDIVPDVQEHVSDIIPDVQEQVSNILADAPEQALDIAPDVQELNGTACDANREVCQHSPQTVLQDTADPSDSKPEGVTKATPLRRMTTRARKRRVTEPPNVASDVAVERASGKLPPKMKAYQKWQHLPSNKDMVCVDKPNDSSTPSIDKIAEKNTIGVDKRKPFTTCISSVYHARKENEETPLKPGYLDPEKLDMDVTKVGSDEPKTLTDVVDVDSLKAEVDQLQKLNTELKSRMKRLDRKSLLHNNDAKERKSLLHNSSDAKALSGGCERAMLSSGGERKIGINWKDMKFSVRKTTPAGVSPRNTSPKDKDSAENKAYARKMDDLATRGRELVHREEMTDRKEQRLKALDMELDRRSSIIKCREAKLERLEGQLKARESALVMREKRLSGREHRETNGEDANERVAGQPKDSKLNEREKQVQAKEKDLETKQQLLQTTERQLTALGRELADKFHYLKVKQGRRDITSVSVAMASVVASQKGRASKVAKGQSAVSPRCDGNNNDSSRMKPALEVQKANRAGATHLGETNKPTQQSATSKATPQSELILLTNKVTQLGATKKVAKMGATKKVAKLGATKKVARLGVAKKVAKMDATKKVAKLGAAKKVAKLGVAKKLTKLGVSKKLTAAKMSKLSATKKMKLNATKKLTKLNATKKMTKLNDAKKTTKLSAAKKATKQPTVKKTISIASERTNHPKPVSNIVMESKKKTANKRQVSANTSVCRGFLSNHSSTLRFLLCFSDAVILNYLCTVYIYIIQILCVSVCQV